MDTVQAILNQFSDCEKEQLFSIASSRNSPNSKKLKLFDLYLKFPQGKDSFYSKKIYGEAENGAFSQLKRRLKDEIEEIMVLIKPSKLENRDQKRIACLELILKSQLVFARGLKCEGAKLLEKSLKSSIENQFQDLVLTIFSIALDHGVPEVLSKKDLPQIEIAIKSHLQILVSQCNTNETISESKPRNELLAKLVNQLNSNRQHWNMVNSLKNSIERENLEEGLEIIQGIEPREIFFENDPKAYSEFLNSKLELLILNGNYQEVCEICQENQQKNGKNQQETLEFYEFYFLGAFYSGRYEDALRILSKKLYPLFPTQKAKWTYWEALVNVNLKEYKNALQLLHSCQPDLKYSSDYYLASKLFEIIVLIEQGDQDWLEYKMENFRKLLARWKKNSHLHIKWAFKTIQKIYGSNQLIQVMEENLLLWPSRDKQYAWCPLSFELIRLDTWIQKSFQKLTAGTI